ncbi:MAG: hypothetical protein ACJAS1_003271 [Oleiphilaceae bacterium]|jgi:hypothetical protein
MNTFFKVSTLGLLISFTYGCSTLDEGKPDLSALAPDACTFQNTKEEAPMWTCTGEFEGLVAGRGSFKQVNASENLSFQIAQQRARADLARKLLVELKTSLSDYESAAGDAFDARVDTHVQGINKSELQMPLEGSRVYASVTSPDGTLYVLVGLDEDLAKKNKLRAIKNSFRDPAAQWAKSEADKAYDKLEAYLDKQ